RVTTFLPLSVLLTCLRPVSAPAPWSKAIFPQAETANEWTAKLPDPLQPPRLRQPRQGHSSAGVAAGLVTRVVVGHALAERTPPPRPGVGEVGRPQQRRRRPALCHQRPGCRRGSCRERRSSPAGQGRPDLRPQPRDRAAESRHGPTDLLAPVTPGLGAKHRSNTAERGPAAVRSSSKRPMGRPGRAAGIAMGWLSGKPWTWDARPFTDSGPVLPTSARAPSADVSADRPATRRPRARRAAGRPAVLTTQLRAGNQ